ncbi:MAG: hypothetical protein IIT65_05635 [Lachnospiraceae bacterium]|nr:hypothetical protein [Lachnospiraceae bacterium]
MKKTMETEVYKLTSHVKSMDADNRPSAIKRNLNGSHEFLKDEYIADNRGVMQKRGYISSIDPKEEMSKYRVSDFYLENIIAAGAVGNLKECSASYGVLENAEIADRVMDSIDNAEIDAIVNNDNNE